MTPFPQISAPLLWPSVCCNLFLLLRCSSLPRLILVHDSTPQSRTVLSPSAATVSIIRRTIWSNSLRSPGVSRGVWLPHYSLEFLGDRLALFDSQSCKKNANKATAISNVLEASPGFSEFYWKHHQEEKCFFVTKGIIWHSFLQPIFFFRWSKQSFIHCYAIVFHRE